MAWIGAAISGVAGLVGASNSSDAATQAAQTQANAANQASQLQYQLGQQSLGLQQSVYNQGTQNFAPYLNAGNSALNTYLQMLGLGPSNPNSQTAPVQVPGLPGSGGQQQAAAPAATSSIPGVPAGMVPWTPTADAHNGNPSAPPPGSVNVGGKIYAAPTNNPFQAATVSTAPAPAAGGGKMQPQAFSASPGASGALVPGATPGAIGAGTFDFSKYLSSLPGYQFQKQEGEASLNNLISSGQVAPGGNAARGAIEFGQGLGSSYFDKWMGQLAGLTSAGQSAAGQQGSLGNTLAAGASSTLSNVGTQVGNNTIGAGNATAAGQVGSANAWTSLLNSIGKNGSSVASLFTPTTPSVDTSGTNLFAGQVPASSFQGF